MPILDTISSGIWQPGSATTSLGTAIADAEYKRWQTTIHFGHDTAARMANLRPLLLQVSNLNGAASLKTSDYYMLKVTCPVDLRYVFKCPLAVVSNMCFDLFELLLVMFGDVELNPGLMTQVEAAESLAAALDSMHRLEQVQAANIERICKLEEQASLLADLKCVHRDRASTLEMVRELKQVDGD